jgi:hypothetical protein
VIAPYDFEDISGFEIGSRARRAVDACTLDSKAGRARRQNNVGNTEWEDKPY